MRARYPHKLKRLGRIALQNLQRNLLLSVATTIMMGLILFIFNVILVLSLLTDASLGELGEKVDLIVYLSDDISLVEISDIQNFLREQPEVIQVDYTSKEAALEEFLSIYPDKEDPFTVYGIENPLPANIHIITESPDQHETVLTSLNSSPYAETLLDVESSNENQEIVARLLSVTNFTKKLIIGVTVTFVFGSLLMIMNAIHLSIFTRQTEIQIMQLVGAKPSMIRLPFVFEGGLYSLLAVLLSFILLIFFLEGTQLSELETLQNSFKPQLLFGLELVASTTIGICSSFLALNYYLKRNLILKSSS